MAEEMKKISPEEYAERFDKLYNLLSNVHMVFYVWKGLQKKEYEETYHTNNHFWTAVLLSLKNTWLINLARLYENSTYSKNNSVISVYALLLHCSNSSNRKKAENILKKQGVIGNLKIMRDRQLAHNDAKHLLNPKSVNAQFPIKYGDIESLLKKSREILQLLHPENHGFILSSLEENSQADAELLICKIKYFNKKRKEHFDKFIKGEVSTRFPGYETNQ